VRHRPWRARSQSRLAWRMRLGCSTPHLRLHPWPRGKSCDELDTGCVAMAETGYQIGHAMAFPKKGINMSIRNSLAL
jgi:hypothetical protein